MRAWGDPLTGRLPPVVPAVRQLAAATMIVNPDGALRPFDLDNEADWAWLAERLAQAPRWRMGEKWMP